MANLSEIDQWIAGIYQLEEDDPVLGGPSGIDNRAPRELASRTLFQRLRNVTPWDATLSYPALTAYVSYNGTTWKSVGESINVAPGTDTAKWVRWGHTAAELSAALGDSVAEHEAKADPHTAYWNDTRGNAKISAAITALVNGAPGQLDTLAELAAAIANDANFAGTVANALALKAPLASPAFTGNPTAPTQAAFDNSTKLASTGFIQSRGIQSRGLVSVNAAATLDATHAGATVVFLGASSFAVNLPQPATLTSGVRISFVCGVSSGAVTLSRQGAAQIYMNPGSAKTSILLTQGDTLTLETNGADWYAVDGSAQLQYSPQFAGSLAANGYHRFPNGTIWQWGKVSNPSYPTGNAFVTTAVTFPIPFPSACYTVTGGLNLGILPSGFTNSSCEVATLTGFNWVYSAASAAVAPVLSYQAIGK